MHNPLILAVVTWLLATPTAAAGGLDEPAWITDSREAARALGASLLSELAGALADSPVAAIEVCSERAPAIAAAESGRRGATLGRTALGFRNPANAPADWQRAVLERFARELAAGADPASLEHAEEVVAEGVLERRWMKPIMTVPLCLPCHGEALAPEVAAAIAARYPQDRATGFAAGDLRGAFYVVWRGTRDR